MLTNAFSLTMLTDVVQYEEEATLRVARASEEDARAALARGSAIGHAATAAVLTRRLGVEVPVERRTITIRPGESCVVAQLTGPRLPEGAVLDEAALAKIPITFLKVIREK